MGIMSKFEAGMRGLVEGTFGRLIRTNLQRNEFGPQVERAMESHLRGSPNGREAPTLYDIYLSSKDYGIYGHDARLAQEMSTQLVLMARDRNYWLERNPVIRFREDPHVITGQMRIEAYILDQDAAPSGVDIGDETRSIGPADMQKLNEDIARAQAQQQDVSLPPAWLTLYRPTRGQPMRLVHSPIHIGRHLSNEIIVNDRRVSRHHAEIRYERGQFVLYDLSSTNGVKINGAPTRQPVPLRNNDVITVGDHEFVFQRR
jgi:hypothetical protein